MRHRLHRVRRCLSDRRLARDRIRAGTRYRAVHLLCRLYRGVPRGRDHLYPRLATRRLQTRGLVATGDRPLQIDALARDLRRLLGRSLRLREVSAGGCNGCEVEVNALGNVVFDSSRFGIDFVASPRHADGVLVTGPVTANMKEALLITYQAIAEPKLVIAAGACAISGGIYRDHEEVSNGIEGLLPVDLYVAGCPPHPYTILDGLLRLLGRL